MARRPAVPITRTVYYVDPDRFANVGELVEQALKSDWTSVLAAELLKTSRVRNIKQARFRRGLMMTVVSFSHSGASSSFEALPSLDEKRTPTETPETANNRPDHVGHNQKVSAI